MESKTKDDMIRVTWYEGRLSVDPTGKAKGRGVYICKDKDCLAKARKRGAIARSLRLDPGKDQVEEAFAELEKQLDELLAAKPAAEGEGNAQ